MDNNAHQKQLKERIYYLHKLELDLAKRKAERAEILYDVWSDEVDKRLARYGVIEAYRRFKFYRKTIVDEILRLDTLRYNAQRQIDKQFFDNCQAISE